MQMDAPSGIAEWQKVHYYIPTTLPTGRDDGQSYSTK